MFFSSFYLKYLQCSSKMQKSAENWLPKIGQIPVLDIFEMSKLKFFQLLGIQNVRSLFLVPFFQLPTSFSNIYVWNTYNVLVKRENGGKNVDKSIEKSYFFSNFRCPTLLLFILKNNTKPETLFSLNSVRLCFDFDLSNFITW